MGTAAARPRSIRDAYETEMPSIRATSLSRFPLVARAIRSSLPISIDERRDASMASASGWARYGILRIVGGGPYAPLIDSVLSGEDTTTLCVHCFHLAPGATNGEAQSLVGLLIPQACAR
jgi:hypothetical protein